MINQVYADKAFLGADGLDVRAGLTTPSMAVATIELAMIRRTRGEVVVLADSSKIGLVAPHRHLPARPDRRGRWSTTASTRRWSKQIQRAGPQCEVV